jgi:hypothetical protein
MLTNEPSFALNWIESELNPVLVNPTQNSRKHYLFLFLPLCQLQMLETRILLYLKTAFIISFFMHHMHTKEKKAKRRLIPTWGKETKKSFLQNDDNQWVIVGWYL